MRQLAIVANLPDERALAFAGAKVVLAIPTTQEAYVAFFADCQAMAQSIGLLRGAVAKLDHPATTPEERVPVFPVLGNLVHEMDEGHRRCMAYLGQIEAIVGGVTIGETERLQ